MSSEFVPLTVFTISCVLMPFTLNVAAISLKTNEAVQQVSSWSMIQLAGEENGLASWWPPDWEEGFRHVVLLNVDIKAALKGPSLVTNAGSNCRIVEVKANRLLFPLWHSGFL